jgi:hypothetical protein
MSSRATRARRARKHAVHDLLAQLTASSLNTSTEWARVRMHAAKRERECLAEERDSLREECFGEVVERLVVALAGRRLGVDVSHLEGTALVRTATRAVSFERRAARVMETADADYTKVAMFRPRSRAFDRALALRITRAADEDEAPVPALDRPRETKFYQRALLAADARAEQSHGLSPDADAPGEASDDETEDPSDMDGDGDGDDDDDDGDDESSSDTQ